MRRVRKGRESKREREGEGTPTHPHYTYTQPVAPPSPPTHTIVDEGQVRSGDIHDEECRLWKHIGKKGQVKQFRLELEHALCKPE